MGRTLASLIRGMAALANVFLFCMCAPLMGWAYLAAATTSIQHLLVGGLTIGCWVAGLCNVATLVAEPHRAARWWMIVSLNAAIGLTFAWLGVRDVLAGRATVNIVMSFVPVGVAILSILAFTLKPAEPGEGRCRGCGYDLAGLHDRPCPECGTVQTT